MNNLLKMDRYQLFHNRVYWYAAAGIFLLGFFTADTYVNEVMGPAGGAARSLSDILNGMVYDSTFLLIIISCILALTLGQEFSWRTIGQEICAGHRRLQIFSSKILVYLTAFNLMALIYPASGCLRESIRFGLDDPSLFLLQFIKAIVYSILLNSAIFLIPVLCCFWLRDTSKAVAVSALLTFTLSLYLGYGMMLKLPVGFLPTFQIREAVLSPGFLFPKSLAVAFLWLGLLLFTAWRFFRRCELK